MINYTTKIDVLKTKNTNTLNNVVYKIGITVTGVDENGLTDNHSKWCHLQEPGLNNFIDYDNLTKEQVNNWILETENECKIVVETLINNQKNILETTEETINSDKSLPWENN